MQREMQLPKLRSDASVAPNTFNEERRTVEVRFYSGAAVQRVPFFGEPYELSFDLDSRAVRLDRFNSGAPLLDNHASYGSVSEAVLGVVEKAWMDKDGGHARIRFSRRSDVEPVLADIRDGILKNFSMGAVIHQLKDITEKGDKQRRLLAIDWEPHELSIVPVPADPGAQALSHQQLAQAEKFPCKVTLSAEASANAPKERKMKVRLVGTDEIVDILEAEFDEALHTTDLGTQKPPKVADTKSEERELADAIEADTKRAARIRELAIHFELDDLWAQRQIKLGSSIKAAIADGRKRVAESAPSIDGRLSVEQDYDSSGWKSKQMVEALHARAHGGACPEPARAFARMSVAECAYALLHQLGMTRGRALDALRNPYDVIKLAMSTSDFPGLLANLLNKDLQAAYGQAMPSFRRISRLKQFKDYRPHKFVRTGDFPIPLQVGENGEITQGAMGESSETVTALKYGRILAIGYETLVNDDLNALVDFGGMVARRILDFENATFYSRVITTAAGLGPNLADGVAVYNAAHGANVGSGGAISNTLFGEAFGRLAAMTSIDGLKLNIPPSIVLTSPASHVSARTLLAAIYPAQASNVNPFAGIMEAIYDANLTGTRFYVLADPANGSNYVHGTIGGAGPRYEVRNGFEVEGVQVKVVHDFGCGAIDYRFGYTAAGA